MQCARVIIRARSNVANCKECLLFVSFRFVGYQLFICMFHKSGKPGNARMMEKLFVEYLKTVKKKSFENFVFFYICC